MLMMMMMLRIPCVFCSRDTNGQWTSKKNELVYADFKPKVPAQGNKVCPPFASL